MKAIAVTPGNKSVGIIDQPEPRISTPTDVKLRMIEAGVCGTDKEICAFEYGTPPSGMEQLVIGHESLGEVVGVGAQVTRVKVGDLVVPMVRRPCPPRLLHRMPLRPSGLLFYGRFYRAGHKTAAWVHGAVRRR